MATLTTTPINQSVFQKLFDTLRCPLLLNIVFIGEAAVRTRTTRPANHPTHSLKRQNRRL
jgi:hypothetical protein